MADTEAVVTRFAIDLAEFQAKIDQAKAFLADYSKEAGKAGAATDHLQVSSGSAAAKVALLAEAHKRAAQAEAEQAKAADLSRAAFEKQVASLTGVIEQRKKITQALRDNDKEFKALTKTIEDSGIKSDELTKAVEVNRTAHAALSKQLATVTADERFLRKEVGEASKTMISNAEAAKKAADATLRAGDAFKKTALAAVAEASAAKAAAISNAQFARSAARLAASGANFSVLQRITQAFRNFGTTVKASFATAFSSVRSGNGAINTLKKGLNDASVAVPRLGGLFRLLVSPVGLVAGAVAGLLLNFTRLDSVKTSLDGIKRGFGLILDQLASGTLSVRGFFDAFSTGKELAENASRLQASADLLTLATADQEKELARLLRLSKDRTLSVEDQVKLLKQVQALEEDISRQQLVQARADAEQDTKVFIEKLIAQNDLTEEQEKTLRNIKILHDEDLKTIDAMQKKGNALANSPGGLLFGLGKAGALDQDAEARRKAVDSRRALTSIEIEAQEIILRAQNRINFVQEQGADERDAASQKEIERQLKIIELANELQGIDRGLDDETIRAGLSEIEKAVFDSDKKFANLKAGVEKLFVDMAKLGAAVPQAEQKQLFDKVEADRAAAEKLLRENAEVAAIKQETDTQRAIRDIILSENEAKLQAIRDDHQKLLDENKKFITDEVKQEENRVAILADLNADLAAERLRQEKEANAERLKLEEEVQERQRKLLEDSINVLGDFLEGSIALLSQRNEGEAALRAERLGAIEEDFAAQLAANEQFDQSEQNRARKRASILAEQDRALAAERARIGEEEQATREKQSKAFIGLLLDNLQKVVEMAALEIIAQSAAKGAAIGGPIGALAGIAQGTLIAIAIRTLFAGLKAAIGAYEGDPYVKGPEGRDRVPYMLTRGERVVTRGDNQEHWNMLEAMRTKRLDQFIHLHYVKPALKDQQFNAEKYLSYDPIVNINRYLNGETGGRVASAATFPRNFDRGMVEAIMRNGERQKQTNDLLAAQLELAKKSRRHSATWS